MLSDLKKGRWLVSWKGKLFHVVFRLKRKNRNGKNYKYLSHVVEVQIFIENKFPLHYENILQARLIKTVMTISTLLSISRKAMTFPNKRASNNKKDDRAAPHK